jgi:hypothetical protein
MKNNKQTPYCHLPRRQQRDSFIRLRQKIRNNIAVYGGQFFSHHVLDEPGRPAIYNQWADVYFLGGDGLTIWNACLITAASEFWETSEDMAHSRAWEMLTPEERSAEAEIKFEPVWSNGQRMYRMLERPHITYDKFGGLTFRDYQEKINEEIIQNEPPAIFESFTLDRSYRYGIGLNIVIHTGEINRASIEEAIRRFRAIGEKDWRAENPVPRNELPQESMNAAFQKIEMNAGYAEMEE